MSHHTIIVHCTLGDLLKRVPELMLSPKAAREHLTSLASYGSTTPQDRWNPSWFPATSQMLSSVLTADELALEITLVFESTEANVRINDPDGRRLGFLTTEQARSLTEGVWERLLN